MRPPRDMDIIEIELTNSCVHRCSNCTRFCGHHTNPFFMSFETFRRAVDSMEGFHGTLSLMGGEPTLHPEFEKFARYLHEKLPLKKRKQSNPFIYPQCDLMRAVGMQNLRHMEHFPTKIGGSKTCVDGAGTFSSMGLSYMKHYEVIQDTLKFEGLNDHTNAMYHQPILISRKDLGIDDETWYKLRDNCWINNQWSASITPKGAFFCEIAGALDMLFDGPGGLTIEPGWWKKDICEFGEQLNWCEMCGMAIHTYSRDANEEIDDISPQLYAKLQSLKDKKVGSRHVNIVQIKDGKISEESRKQASDYRGDFYSTSYSSRFTATASVVYPKGFEVYELQSRESLGHMLYHAILSSKDGYYIVVTNGTRRFTKADEECWQKYTVNPGTLHLSIDSDGSFIALFHKYALALKQMGMDRVLSCNAIGEFAHKWITEKVIDFDTALQHEAGGFHINPNLRLVQYGAGNNGEVFLKELLAQEADVIAVVDSDPAKAGKLFCGIKIYEPGYLESERDEYDAIVIASTDYYDEILQSLTEQGIPKDKIFDNKQLW